MNAVLGNGRRMLRSVCCVMDFHIGDCTNIGDWHSGVDRGGGDEGERGIEIRDARNDLSVVSISCRLCTALWHAEVVRRSSQPGAISLV